MPRVAPGQRKRAYRPKTRTGCHTCRTELICWLARRVKCDEGKPYCDTCTSTGRRCDGYGTTMEARSDLSGTLSDAMYQSPSIGFLATEQECWSFCFFRENTAPQLSMFFGNDFWETLLLQTALHEPSIRYTILALGFLHKNSEQDNGLITHKSTDGKTNDFSSRRYSYAINTLVERLSREGQQAIDVSLICSLLFACLEAMQGNYGAAITHVQSGIKILCEIKYNDETRYRRQNARGASVVSYIPINMLEAIFMRLDLQVIQMVSGQNWEIYESMKKYAQTREIPAVFLDLAKARESLVSSWHVALSSTSDKWDMTNKNIPAVPQAGAWETKSTSILARWSSAYDAYLDIQGDNLTDTKRKGTAALCILKELGSTSKVFAQTTVDDERNWDVFCPMFQKIISLAEDIIQLNLRSVVGTPQFCIDMAIVAPLFKVSCRCRDPVIRRRAILALRNYNRIEMGWDSFLTAKVAQRVLNIEESGLRDVRSCDDIPDWARISDVLPVFDPLGRRATLFYSRFETKHDLDRQVTEEMIER